MRRTNPVLRTSAVLATAVTAAGLLSVLGGSPAGAATQVLPTTPTGTTTVQRVPAKVANTTGVAGVIAYDTSGYPGPGEPNSGTVQYGHVSGPVKYSVTPPIGGPHNGTWMNAGTYTAPIPSERAVHNLEHGAVWITYRPNVKTTTVATLQSFVHKQSVLPEGRLEPGGPVQGNRFIDMSPWRDNDLPAPIVISSWGYQLYLYSASDPRLQQFVDTFRRSAKYSPERNAPVDGVKVSIGGRAARDGAVHPNPS